MDEQGMFYNGWQHAHYVTNLLVFAIDGRVIMAVMNAPGSIHDSTLAEWGDVYSELEVVHGRTGGVCCVDSAFAANKNPYLIKSSQSISGHESPLQMLQKDQATSLRQAAEWGMRAIQGAFPRLKDAIHYEENGERRVFLSLVPLLYNFRPETVGLNQLRNTYCPSWGVDAKDFIIAP